MDIVKADCQIYNTGCFKGSDGMDMNLAHSCGFAHYTAPSRTDRFHQFGDEMMDQNRAKAYRDGGFDHDFSDADYYSIIPSELEDLILARFPRSEYWKLCFLSKRCRALVRSGVLFKIRREIGFQEHSVLMQASGDNTWWAFDREFKSCRKLPDFGADPCFRYGDKQSVCAGTSLLVSGRGVDGHVIWRYEMITNKWEKAPAMQTRRSLFASATCGNYAYVAGGTDETNARVYDTAERYNSESNSWEALPRMNKRRKLCSGIYMDDKFYVIGGRNEEGELTCGEYFNEVNNRWELIPDMIKDNPVKTGHGPSLLAVVDNELYSLEACSSQLKVYNKKTNSWKHLGQVPVKADSHKGWGVAFKSMGNELLVIGASMASPASMAMYTCSPHPSATSELHWKPLDSGRNWFSNFVLNCSVMTA